MGKRGAVLLVFAGAALFAVICYVLIYALTPRFFGVVIGQSEYGPYLFEAYGESAQNAIEQSAVRIAITQETVQHGPDSDVARINESAGQMVKVDPATIYLAERASHFNRATMGRFSVLNYMAKKAWGLYESPRDEELIENLEPNPDMEGLYVDFTRDEVGVDADMLLDFSPMLAAYCVDQAYATGNDYGLKDAYYQIGDVAYASGKSANGGWWSYSIPHPEQPLMYLGVLLVGDQACATVGAYQGLAYTQQGEALLGVIDPRENAPARSDVLSVTVIAPTAIEASVYAQAIAVSGRSEGEALINQFNEVYAVIVTKDMRVWCSPAMLERFALRADEFVMW